MPTSANGKRIYVVTAATGRTGSIVARGLLEAGHTVRAIGRDGDRLKPLRELGAEIVVGNVRDEDFMRESFAAATAAYLIVNGDHDARDFRRDFADCGEVYARAAEATALPAAVFLSTIGTHDPRHRGFVLTHSDVEHRLDRLTRTRILHLRAPQFMENLFYFLPASQAGGALVTPIDPDARLDMAYSKDIGEAALKRLLALDFDGHSAVELHAQEALSMREIAERLSSVAGREMAARRHAREDYIDGMLDAGMQRDFAELISDTWDTFSRHGLLRAPTSRPHMQATTSVDTFLAADFVPVFDTAGEAGRS